MDPRTLQLIQRALVAAVTVVLALVIITTFMKVIQTSDETVSVRSSTTATPATGAGTSTSTSLASVLTSTTNGGVTQAICSEPEPPSGDATILRVYFPCGAGDLATEGTFVYRAVAPTDLVLTTTLREMAKGLEPEEVALGYKSPLPETAAGSFLGVSLSEGKAFLEFNTTVFPDGVDTPEGSQIFLSTLNANVFQFDTINEAEYRLGGSCDAFWQRLGSSCEIVTRAQWQAQLAGG